MRMCMSMAEIGFNKIHRLFYSGFFPKKISIRLLFNFRYVIVAKKKMN